MIVKYYLLLLFILSRSVSAVTFKQAVKLIENHESVKLLINTSNILYEEARVKGAWGDLNFKVNAKNFPVKTFSFNESPMTGVELSLAQKFPLSKKLSNFKDAYIAKSNSKKISSKQQQRSLKKILWQLSISKEKINLDLITYRKNLNWLKRMLKISKNLYSNGKIPQSALLDIQIRISEVETKFSNLRFELKEIDKKLSYILDGKELSLDLRSIPWKVLTYKGSNPKYDYEKKFHQKILESRDFEMRAYDSNRIPDLTFSFGYTFRSKNWKEGDFVSAFINFPLPTGSTRSASYKKAVYGKYEAKNILRNYEINKESNLGYLRESINKLKEELKILESKTLQFARSLRKITSTSYGLGNSTYIELLDAEIKLLNILLRENKLNAHLKNLRLERKFVAGGKLDENI
ncbi:MAG: hypothetical protein DRQ89_06745 [Epsilonproteobacteria bacterium]|nr:MAG: hypothetical protein DRQ89_06745 [Campylobacterota bacterium]